MSHEILPESTKKSLARERAEHKRRVEQGYIDSVVGMVDVVPFGMGLQANSWNVTAELEVLVDVAQNSDNDMVRIAAVEAIRRRSIETLKVSGYLKGATETATMRTTSGAVLTKNQKSMSLIKEAAGRAAGLLEPADAPAAPVSPPTKQLPEVEGGDVAQGGLEQPKEATNDEPGTIREEEPEQPGAPDGADSGSGPVSGDGGTSEAKEGGGEEGDGACHKPPTIRRSRVSARSGICGGEGAHIAPAARPLPESEPTCEPLYTGGGGESPYDRAVGGADGCGSGVLPEAGPREDVLEERSSDGLREP